MKLCVSAAELMLSCLYLQGLKVKLDFQTFDEDFRYQNYNSNARPLGAD